MPRLLTKLRIREVSSVNRGAGEGVKVMLSKSADAPASDATKLPDQSKKGWVQKMLAAVGIGKADDFNTAQQNIETGEYAYGMLQEFDEAMQALRQSLFSIINDESVADKKAAVEATFDQYRAHVQRVVPEELEKAMHGAALAVAGFVKQGVPNKEAGNMTPEEKKRLDDAEANCKKAQDDAAVLKRQLAHATLSPVHKGYVADAKLAGDPLNKFLDLSDADRDAHITANPVTKDLPESVVKALAENTEMKKRLEALESSEKRAGFVKMAKDHGLGEEYAEIVEKAHRGDAEAIGKLLQAVKAASAQAVAGGVFKEFGSRGDGSDTSSPDAVLKAKAAEYRKANPGLTEEQAFDKVYTDPANAALAAAERQANRPV